ncbi:DUF1214 domain-containing protein [Leifsonia shinshuensis]|uniref:DUF1214 domain-containing protein n=1 Tax=Leifsonia shinshuensis TaxID=150026 RepID=UPI001F508A02|nr:DUF1214 domain-containing protein [Leifsonia shinshuensis]MCI0158638.1 DUF1214 domain-containing protein [Leifsonia shinshuensis]
MSVSVNVDNFVRAETDRMFDFAQTQSGGVNHWLHYRVPTPFDEQPVIRQNRDTLYSGAIVDVSQGARLTIPEHGDRYASAMIVNQDHYIPRILHEPGTHELTAEECGSDYVLIGVRILVDPNDAGDVAAVNALQDRFGIEAASAVPLTHPDYDTASFDATRGHLIALSRGLPDFRNAFGRAGEVDEVRHLLASASAWGGFPESEAIYLNVEPDLPVGHYELTVRDVPVDAFWSITVYNADGYLVDNPRGIVSVNSVTATPNDDGSVTIRFGDGDEPNSIPTPDGWNYMVRLYQPQAAARSREWTFPALSR